MNELFKKHIDIQALGVVDPSALHCEIQDAFLLRDTNELNTMISLNFVMPWEADHEICQDLKASIPGISGVVLHYHYEKEKLAVSPEDAARILIPRLIHESRNAMKNGVDFDSIDFSSDEVRIATISKLATQQLNRKLADRLSHNLEQCIGLKRKVRFQNDEKQIEEARRAKAMHEDREQSAIAREQEEQRKRVAQKREEDKQSATSAPPFAMEADKKPFRGGRRRSSFSYGNPIAGKVTPLSDLVPELGQVVVEGMIFKVDTRPIKNDRILAKLNITDKRTSTTLKFFISTEQWDEIAGNLKPGNYIAAAGETEFDTYDHCLSIMIQKIQPREAPSRKDTFDGQHRVELHAHTKMSDMDGLNEVATLVKLAASWGQPAVAITDHGVVQGFPDAASAAKKCTDAGKPIKVIFGMEGYVFEDKDRHASDGSIDYKGSKDNPVRTNHIILLVKSQEGMKNMYKLVSRSHIDYFYRKPRLPKSLIAEHREGLIIGSACEAGEVYRAVRDGLSEAEVEEIASFYDYLEIQPLINNRFMLESDRYPNVNTYEDLKDINRRIIALADKLGKPIVATTDAHYDEPESAIYRNIIMKGKGFADAENGEGLYLRTTAEMLKEFSYLGEDEAYRVVVENTNKIAEMVEDGILPVPKEKCPPRIAGAEETLRKTCMDRAHAMYGEQLPQEIADRLDTELNAIISNGYAVMYVSAQMLVHKSNADGYLVGSRGSVGSSFAATMAGITEVNPLNPHYICPNCKKLEWGDMQEYDCGIDMPEKACPECGTMMRRDGFTIPFATFLGFKGNKEPDIDLNFAGEYQPRAHRYVGEIFGDENVFKAGTVGTVAEKTAKGFVLKFAEETGQAFSSSELERLAEGCTGVKRTTGQHPGGIVIVPDDREIYEFCPIQRPANDSKSDITTTHFDYHKIDQNLLKLDILGHNVPSMIRHLQDMTGIDPMEIDLSDRTVFGIFNGIEPLKILDPDYKFVHGSYGIPEFGTSFVRGMLDDTKPQKFADLVRISGFSHGTDVWLNNAQEYIRNGIATMREAISTRDDIMNYLILKGIENETSFHIMEDVRKNRPLKPEQLEIMKAHGVPDWYIESCIKIQYMFPRAHAVAYVMMSYRMAWYKVYYPLEFYAATFSSMLSDFEADRVMGGAQACISRIQEIQRMSKEEAKKEEGHQIVLELAYEMYSRGFTFADAKFGASEATRFCVVDGKVQLPFAAFSGVGENAAKSLVSAYEEKPFDTVEDAIKRSRVSNTVIETLRSHGVFEGLPETDQISWGF